MIYFGDVINDFLANACVVKGSVYDSSLSVSYMELEKPFLDAIHKQLVAGGGDYLKWRGELLSIAGPHLVSDQPDTQLGEYYGLDLKSDIPAIQKRFSQGVDAFLKIEKINSAAPFDCVLPEFNRTERILTMAGSALSAFASKFKRAVKHGLACPDRAYISASLFTEQMSVTDDFVSDSDCLNVGTMLHSFLDGYDVAVHNAPYFRLKANNLTRRFCAKKDYKNFIKFMFSPIELWPDGKIYDYSARSEFKESKKSLVVALIHQGYHSLANTIQELDEKEMVKMDISEQLDVAPGLTFTRRKYCFELKLNHALAQQLQIFLLKYNRDEVVKLAA